MKMIINEKKNLESKQCSIKKNVEVGGVRDGGLSSSLRYI